MKTLNLDALAKTVRTITLGGEKYNVEEMTVKNFIETTNAASRLEKKEDVSIAEQIQATIEMIQRSIPKCPAEKLSGLTLEQLATISKFLRGELDGEDDGDSEVAAEGEEKK